MKLRCACGFVMQLMVDQCKHISYLYSEEIFEKSFVQLSESKRTDSDFDNFYSKMLETRREIYFCSNCHRHYIEQKGRMQRYQSYVPENEMEEHETGCFAPDTYVDDNGLEAP